MRSRFVDMKFMRRFCEAKYDMADEPVSLRDEVWETAAAETQGNAMRDAVKVERVYGNVVDVVRKAQEIAARSKPRA